MNELCDYNDVYIDQIDLKGAFTGYLEGDNPFLEELGIEIRTIFLESSVVFEMFGIKNEHFNFQASDNIGPLIFLLFYSIFLMINGKIHFGYIYFLSLVSNVFTYFLLNVISEASINILESFSIMGYSMIPVSIFAFLNIFLNYFSIPLRLVFGTIFAIWSSSSGSKIFVKFLKIKNMFFIVWYPLFLIYFCFVLIAIF